MKEKMRCIPLKVLRQLMKGRIMSTQELVEICNCNRKSIYESIDLLESFGFHIEITKGYRGMNMYMLDNNIFGYVD